MEFNQQNNEDNQQLKQNMTINSYKQSEFITKQPVNRQNRYSVDSYMKKNKKATKIHYIIPQHRAHLLQLSEKYQDNEPQKISKPQNAKDKQRLFDQTLVYFRALSNPQSYAQNVNPSANDSQQFSLQIQNDFSSTKDNSFINQSQQGSKKEEKYRQTYASSFKSQGRENYYKQEQKNLDNPSPAEYLINIGFQQKRYLNLFKNNNNSFTQERIKNKKIASKNISEIIHDNRFFLQNYVDTKPVQESVKKSNVVKKSHMFVDNEKDRYGNFEIINNKTQISPQQYQVNHYTIEKKYQAIKQQQDQKKLLKQWLKPKQIMQ